MSPTAPLPVLSQQIQSLSREQCIEELLHFRYLPFDFNRRFLDRLTLERLRYIILAAYETAKKYHF